MDLDKILNRVNATPSAAVVITPNTKDGNRTKEFQDFFTPNNIAEELFINSKKYLKPPPYVNKLLEPTVGSGNLIWVFLESEFNIDILCMDIQNQYINFVKKESLLRGYKIYYDKNQNLHIANN